MHLQGVKPIPLSLIDSAFAWSMSILFVACGAGGGETVTDIGRCLAGDCRVSHDGFVEAIVAPDIFEVGSGEMSVFICPEGGGETGCPCEVGEDCQSSICMMHMGDRYCSESCVEECPGGWTCAETAVGGVDRMYVCTSLYPSLCLPCVVSSDCQAANERCVLYGDDVGRFCGVACSVSQPCPAGYDCQISETAEGEHLAQCVLDGQECPCSGYAAQQQLHTVCALSNEHGTCPGWRTCGNELYLLEWPAGL